ncbi:MAG: VWA domain-containing protein [Actinomycetota bacterium]|nr:VWA domain-containing protein [Actinomycetota bacterium]
MGASWIRREFGAVGVTQYPQGPCLVAVQEHLLGTALLCIDVSGSMSGPPLQAAIDGGLDFLHEAEQAGYRCGLVLWHHGMDAYLSASTASIEVARRLRAARASGGNDLRPTLRAAIKELGPLEGDRVVCVFGDGDVGSDERGVEALANQARTLGIRFVVRGLGTHASASLSRTLGPDESAQPESTVADVAGLRSGIASMAQALKITR